MLQMSKGGINKANILVKGLKKVSQNGNLFPLRVTIFRPQNSCPIVPPLNTISKGLKMTINKIGRMADTESIQVCLK